MGGVDPGDHFPSSCAAESTTTLQCSLHLSVSHPCQRILGGCIGREEGEKLSSSVERLRILTIISDIASSFQDCFCSFNYRTCSTIWLQWCTLTGEVRLSFRQNFSSAYIYFSWSLLQKRKEKKKNSGVGTFDRSFQFTYLSSLKSNHRKKGWGVADMIFFAQF